MRRSKGRTLYRPDGIAEVIDLVPTNTLAAIVVHIRLGMRCKLVGEEDMFHRWFTVPFFCDSGTGFVVVDHILANGFTMFGGGDERWATWRRRTIITLQGGGIRCWSCSNPRSGSCYRFGSVVL